jgi:hypothetical protein
VGGSLAFNKVNDLIIFLRQKNNQINKCAWMHITEQSGVGGSLAFNKVNDRIISPRMGKESNKQMHMDVHHGAKRSGREPCF